MKTRFKKLCVILGLSIMLSWAFYTFGWGFFIFILGWSFVVYGANLVVVGKELPNDLPDEKASCLNCGAPAYITLEPGKPVPDTYTCEICGMETELKWD